MNIDRIATKQEIDLCLLIMESHIEEDKMGRIRRDMEFCRVAAQDYKRRKLSQTRKYQELSGLWLLLGMGVSGAVVISALYLLARLA